MTIEPHRLTPEELGRAKRAADDDLLAHIAALEAELAAIRRDNLVVSKCTREDATGGQAHRHGLILVCRPGDYIMVMADGANDVWAGPVPGLVESDPQTGGDRDDGQNDD